MHSRSTKSALIPLFQRGQQKLSPFQKGGTRGILESWHIAGDKGKYPEFAGNVLTVETRDFWIDESLSPRNQGYHYNRNAETYVLVGDALGRGMCQLLVDTTTRRRRIR